MKRDSFSFSVRGRAAPQGSKRHLGNGIMVEASKRVKPFRVDVQHIAIDATPTGWEMGKEVRLTIDFHFVRPKSHLTSKGKLTKSAPLYPTGRQIGDLDKLSRAVLDSLTNVCYNDDSQVVDLIAKKRFSDLDQTIITVSYV